MHYTKMKACILLEKLTVTNVKGCNNITTNCKTRTSTIQREADKSTWVLNIQFLTNRNVQFQWVEEKEHIWRTDLSRFQDLLESYDNQDCDRSQGIDDLIHGTKSPKAYSHKRSQLIFEKWNKEREMSSVNDDEAIGNLRVKKKSKYYLVTELVFFTKFIYIYHKF